LVPQAQYLTPDPAAVDALVEALSTKKVGVVAHFYMDPQVIILPPLVSESRGCIPVPSGCADPHGPLCASLCTQLHGTALVHAGTPPFLSPPQVQGVLSSAAERWPHIRISDSLVMADGAVGMAEAGCT
jgi:hypothetical protein